MTDDKVSCVEFSECFPLETFVELFLVNFGLLEESKLGPKVNGMFYFKIAILGNFAQKEFEICFSLKLELREKRFSTVR